MKVNQLNWVAKIIDHPKFPTMVKNHLNILNQIKLQNKYNTVKQLGRYNIAKHRSQSRIVESQKGILT